MGVRLRKRPRGNGLRFCWPLESRPPLVEGKEPIRSEEASDRTPTFEGAMGSREHKTKSVAGMEVALCAREIEEVQPLAQLLKRLGCRVQTAESPEELEELVAKEPIHVVLAHVCPSRLQFMEILGRPEMPPVVPLLCHADHDLYIQALRRGAFDCVPLPAGESELVRVLLLASGQQREVSAGATK